MVTQQKTVYRSMLGKEIDMNKLMQQNELTIAVGNKKVNARGDEIGPGGKIIRKREDIIAASNPPAPVPDQTNIRTAPTSVPVTETVTTAQSVIVKKDIANQDPEGNE